MAAVGHMYANGRGVAQDNATAIEWFTRAVSEESGPADASALFGLGYMQLHGYGAPPAVIAARLPVPATRRHGWPDQFTQTVRFNQRAKYLFPAVPAPWLQGCIPRLPSRRCLEVGMQ